MFSLWVKNIKTNIIEKNNTWSYWDKNKKYIGIEIDPINDDNEENFEIIKIKNQTKVKSNPK